MERVACLIPVQIHAGFSIVQGHRLPVVMRRLVDQVQALCEAPGYVQDQATSDHSFGISTILHPFAQHN